MTGAPKIPHGPPPLTVPMSGSGLSSKTFNLGPDLFRCKGLVITVAVGEITTVDVDIDGTETAHYSVDRDFTVSGTLHLMKTTKSEARP